MKGLCVYEPSELKWWMHYCAPTPSVTCISILNEDANNRDAPNILSHLAVKGPRTGREGSILTRALHELLRFSSVFTVSNRLTDRLGGASYEQFKATQQESEDMMCAYQMFSRLLGAYAFCDQ